MFQELLGISAWITALFDGLSAQPQTHVRVTRVVVIEGPRDWVEQTLERSYVPKEGDYRQFGGGKAIRCTALTGERG